MHKEYRKVESIRTIQRRGAILYDLQVEDSGTFVANTIIVGNTKPHKPPIKPIYDWILRNREKLGVQVRTIVKSPKFGIYYREVMSFAWAIAMTIAKEGSEPKPFLRPAINMGKINANAIIKKQIGKWRRNIRKLEKEPMKRI